MKSPLRRESVQVGQELLVQAGFEGYMALREGDGGPLSAWAGPALCRPQSGAALGTQQSA